MHISEIQKAHHEWLTEMGWAGVTTPLEQLALVASEVGEAVNECRGSTPTPNLPHELADIVLRVLGLAEQEGINMEAALLDKMSLNRLRGTKGRIK